MRRPVWSVADVQALGVRTDVPTAGRVLGMGSVTAYDMARRGDFPVPVLKLGRKYVVPVAGLLTALGISQAEQHEKSLGGFATKPSEATNPTLAKRTESL